MNANEENRQDRPDTATSTPIGGTCPSWCVEHDRTDIGHPRDEAVTHLGAVRQVRAPYDDWSSKTMCTKREVQLSQVEFVNTGERWPVVVRVGDDVMPPIEAARNAAELTAVLVEMAGHAR